MFRKDISKGAAFIWVALIWLVYVNTFYALVEGTYVGYLTAIFAFGVALYFFRIIEAGTQAELAFNHNALGYYWDNGPCFLPSIPLLHWIWYRFPWDLITENSNGRWAEKSDEQKRVYIDQRESSYRVNTNVSPLGYMFMRFTDGIVLLIKSVNRGNPDLRYERLATLIIVPTIICGIISTYTTSETAQKEKLPVVIWKTASKYVLSKFGKEVEERKDYTKYERSSSETLTQNTCYQVEENGWAKISINSFPIKMENVNDKILIAMPEKDLWESSWSELRKDAAQPPMVWKGYLTLIIFPEKPNNKICF